MYKAILIMLLSIVSSSAKAEWVQIGGYGGVSIYTDPSNINSQGDIVRMWNVYNYHTAQHLTGGEMYLSIEQQEEFNCKGRQMRTLYYAYRSGNLGEGDPVYTKSLSNDVRWDPVEPDSAGDNLWKYACGKK
jgi:hypothetical protein